MAGVFDFSLTFQEKVLAMLWRDPAFYTLYQEVVKPQYFESDVHMDLTRIVLSFYEKYETPPTLESMLEEVRVLCSHSKLKKEKLKDYLVTVENMMDMNLDDINYVRDKVVTFGQKQALTEAILDSVDDVQKGSDFERVKQRIDAASQVGQNIGDLGTMYFETYKTRIPAYYSKRDIDKIATGVTLLDDVMGGGLGRGELGIVIAPPGTGKTLTLINFGQAGIMSGKNVVHYSMEMNEEIVSSRYDSRFMERDFQYIKDNQDKVTGALSRLVGAKRGQLVVKNYPPRTATVSTLRSHLSSLRISKGFVPDLIIIDYPDLMRPSRDYGEKRHELEMLYEEIRAFGQEVDAATWGASQTNRGALSKKVVTIADLAEAFGKAAVSDFMVALSQTKEEKKNGEVRYYVAKSRNGQSDHTIHCDIDYTIMKVESNAERVTSFDTDDDLQDDETRKQQWKARKERVDNNNKDESEDSVASAILKRAKEKG